MLAHPMNESRVIQTAGRIGSVCVRHCLALVITVLAACALWTVIYFALLLWAVFTDRGIGGPLAYPGGLLFFFLASTAAGLVLLLPSTALAEWFARRRGLPILAQIPLSVAALAVLCLVVVGIVSAVPCAAYFVRRLSRLRRSLSRASCAARPLLVAGTERSTSAHDLSPPSRHFRP
ncbi:MAG: hypothetical protein QOI07_480 [Verrucomicrobiota bacterium]